jgi:hypothetical protein
MTPLFLARRRAERFDSMVEGGRRDDVERATEELLELVGALRSVPEAHARPEFVADLRERLMTAADTELVPAAAARRRREAERLTIKSRHSRRERRIAVAIGAAAVIGATTSMAVASQSAIPGDALYPLKRAIENTEAGFSVGDDAKGETILGNASRRLDEVDKLSKKKDPDAKLVTQTLNTYAQQFTDGSNALLADYEANGNSGSVRQVHQDAADGVTALSHLEGLIPSSAHGALLNAAQTLFAIDADATNLCPTCGDGLTELPSQLVAGATETLGGVTGLLAGGQLDGTAPQGDASGAAQPQSGDGTKGDGTKGGKPSGLNPPETPIQIPTQPSEASNGGGGPLGNVLGNHTHGTGHGGAGNGNGGNGGKGHHGGGVDLGPVTDTVTQVVTGVVEGVNGLLQGLTGGTGH